MDLRTALVRRFITCPCPHLTFSVTAFHDFYPPYHTCIDPECQQYRMDPDGLQECDLTEPVTYSATVLTKDFGAVPCYCTSLYCRSEFLFFFCCYTLI